MKRGSHMRNSWKASRSRFSKRRAIIKRCFCWVTMPTMPKTWQSRTSKTLNINSRIVERTEWSRFSNRNKLLRIELRGKVRVSLWRVKRKVRMKSLTVQQTKFITIAYGLLSSKMAYRTETTLDRVKILSLTLVNQISKDFKSTTRLAKRSDKQQAWKNQMILSTSSQLRVKP